MSLHYQISEEEFNRLESAHGQLALVAGLLGRGGTGDLGTVTGAHLLAFVDQQCDALVKVLSAASSRRIQRGLIDI